LGKHLSEETALSRKIIREVMSISVFEGVHGKGRTIYSKLLIIDFHF